MPTTTDSKDKRLTRGVDKKPVEQAEAYLVLSKDELGKGFTRPLRFSYTHTKCGAKTSMSQSISETYARDPKFYGSTYCVGCKMHLPVNEFTWTDDGEVVGS